MLTNQCLLSTPTRLGNNAMCLSHFKWKICSSERDGPAVCLGLPIPTMGRRQLRPEANFPKPGSFLERPSHLSHIGAVSCTPQSGPQVCISIIDILVVEYNVHINQRP